MSRRAIEASFSLLGIHTLLMGLVCGLAAVCHRYGWWDAGASLTRTAQDMLVAAVIALAVLLLMERSMKQAKSFPARRSSHRAKKL